MRAPGHDAASIRRGELSSIPVDRNPFHGKGIASTAAGNFRAAVRPLARLDVVAGGRCFQWSPGCCAKGCPHRHPAVSFKHPSRIPQPGCGAACLENRQGGKGKERAAGGKGGAAGMRRPGGGRPPTSRYCNYRCRERTSTTFFRPRIVESGSGRGTPAGAAAPRRHRPPRRVAEAAGGRRAAKRAGRGQAPLRLSPSMRYCMTR